MATSADRQTATTFAAAATVTVVAASLFAAVPSPDDEALRAVLRVSGRIAFLVLIIVFAARPLQELLRKPWTAKLLRNRRQLGVAFAGIHSGHLVLIAMRVHASPDLAFKDIASLSGAVVYAVIFAMLITSFTGPARKIGRQAWTVLHKIGLYVLFVGFLASQVPDSPEDFGPANLALTVLAAAAVIVRVSAFLRRRRLLPPRSNPTGN